MNVFPSQLGCAAQHATDEEAVDHDTGQPARLRVAANEFIGYRAAEPVAPALGIEAQQMVAIEMRFDDPQLADGVAIDQMHYQRTVLSEYVARNMRHRDARDFIRIGMASSVADTSRMKRELLPRLAYPTLREGLSLL